MRPVLFGLCALLAAVSQGPSAAAESWRAAGLTFSDELGGVRLISVTGSGSILDPVVIVEELTGLGPAVLVIRGREVRSAEGDIVLEPPFLTLALIKIVINRSGRAWAGFDLELRELLDTPSPYTDGLSFDQMQTFGRPLNSDRFETWRRVAEPYDRVSFTGGRVGPDETVRFSFYITDPTIRREFCLLQEPQILVAGPQPVTAPRQLVERTR